ncbi:MAG: molybdenum cofactor biosynthesis protein B [Nitrospinaceae bacterium]|nr:molybdenum cofactor biosynthesis protein B [Nitrospinaceae bacterium]NIS86818.1 molybdenum cofactor biosynthesis protein B [Nitrospinaceae bacterium]NIT83654.1 molybdenum cofactor biosynthesis protein B [Nitrospinaceae bacterium]NIU98011.1 molybdenum cofactor biosynthesis protein B [Nitrospinaceae bacterium]NIY17018.1 molybdenum cofactor biosynthesis protein B [Nitrospinaceae bacterium]
MDDKSKPKVVNIAVMTVSDTRTEETDKSGQVLSDRIRSAGHTLAVKRIVPDEFDRIQETLKEWIARDDVDVVLATGGTGVTGRDVTPEAFESLYDKAIPGFGELFRWLSYQTIKTSTMQSRATAGVAQGTFLFALPGSTGACKDAWDEILVHQLNSNNPPCNLVELMPRLMEK